MTESEHTLILVLLLFAVLQISNFYKLHMW